MWTRWNKNVDKMEQECDNISRRSQDEWKKQNQQQQQELSSLVKSKQELERFLQECTKEMEEQQERIAFLEQQERDRLAVLEQQRHERKEASEQKRSKLTARYPVRTSHCFAGRYSGGSSSRLDSLHYDHRYVEYSL
jgi:CHAT domain-containing protein